MYACSVYYLLCFFIPEFADYDFDFFFFFEHFNSEAKQYCAAPCLALSRVRRLPLRDMQARMQRRLSMLAIYTYVHAWRTRYDDLVDRRKYVAK